MSTDPQTLTDPQTRAADAGRRTQNFRAAPVSISHVRHQDQGHPMNIFWFRDELSYPGDPAGGSLTGTITEVQTSVIVVDSPPLGRVELDTQDPVMLRRLDLVPGMGIKLIWRAA